MSESIKYPRGEKVWVSSYSSGGQLEYIITTKGTSRDMFYLYTYDGNRFLKFDKSKSPMALEKKYRGERSD